MTDWQWQVILQLIRLVLDLIDKNEIYQSETEILREALKRENK